MAIPLGRTDEDPTQDFIAQESATSIQLTSGDSAGSFTVAEISAGTMGGQLAFAVAGNQDPSSAVSIDLELSIDVSLKD